MHLRRFRKRFCGRPICAAAEMEYDSLCTADGMEETVSHRYRLWR